jgi:tetratricopeptide (TPR) repeat protein
MHEVSKRRYVKALKIARRSSDQSVLVEALTAYGISAAQHEEYETAIQSLEEALRYVVKSGLRLYEVDVHLGLAYTYLGTNNVKSAQAEASCAQDISGVSEYTCGQSESARLLATIANHRD